MFVYYAFCLVLMMLLRPLLVKKIACGLGKSDRFKSIYAALYFFPILTVLQAVGGGLLCKFHDEKSLFSSLVCQSGWVKVFVGTGHGRSCDIKVSAFPCLSFLLFLSLLKQYQRCRIWDKLHEEHINAGRTVQVRLVWVSRKETKIIQDTKPVS